MSKGKTVRAILERRIRYGDYLVNSIPTERELASEIGVSRMTARKAVQGLIEDGLLSREPNGRITVGERGRSKLQVAFLVPSMVSPDVEAWRLGLDATAAHFDAAVRTIMYLHWDDPVIAQALASFDAIFLYFSTEEVPADLIDRLRDSGKPVVAVERDLSPEGVPSIRPFPVSGVHRLLDLLAELGHGSCDCFNIQTVDATIQLRIAQWNLWRAHRRIPGTLLGRPIEAYETPLARAHAEMGRILDAGELQATSLFCTTAPAAIGAVRAMRDRGIEAGRQVSVCVFNDEGFGPYLVPSLTCVRPPDPAPYLSVCLEWMRRGGKDWIGRMLMEPDQVTLFRGESTGVAPNQADLPRN